MDKPSQDTLPVDEVDRTPSSVLRKIALGVTPYPKDDCLECGAIVKIGFFFDGFGRNKDEDELHPTFFSNISRLWQAHRNMITPERPPTHFWYRFYYSGLGAKLNEDAQDDQWIIAAAMAAREVGDHAWKETKKAAREVVGIPRLDPKGRVKKSIKDSLREGSPRPMVQAWSDMRDEIKRIGPTAMQIVDGLREDRILERAKDRLRGTWKGIARHPHKVGWELIKAVGMNLVLENVPIVRDNSIVAHYLGTGFDTRLEAALRQFRRAYELTRSQMPVRRIEVSIFAADRGSAIARQFTNSLVQTYCRRNDEDLAIVEGGEVTQIRIRFMGLFDSVSSIMEENALLDLVPVLDMLKPNYKDRDLAVPAAVEQCVHFAAAQELRFYQRLDSLEKTRGEQYLYPGGSGDVTGVNPAGDQGVHAELSRIPLRDMLHRALIAGSALMTTEEMFRNDKLIFNSFTLSRPITEEGRTFRILDLVRAYRDLVPYTPGLDFLPHMKVYVRWLAVRYHDPQFRQAMEEPLANYAEERNVPAAEDAYNDELRRQMAMTAAERSLPENQRKIAELKTRLEERRTALANSRGVAPPDFHSIWRRIAEEAGHLDDYLNAEDKTIRAEQEIAERNKPSAPDGAQFYNERLRRRGETIRQTRRRHRLSAEQAELIRTWRRASQGLDPLPDKVMILFDALVHDTMLSSWQDHLLASAPLYFRLRDKDTFGVTDYAEEAAKRRRDDVTVERMDRAGKAVIANH